MPMVQADWGFTGEEAVREGEEDLAKTLMCVDKDTTMTHAIDAPTKEASAPTVTAVCDFAKTMGHRELEFRTDGEPAMRALQSKVSSERLRNGLKTTISNGKTHDSQNMGQVESAIRWWRGKALTLKYATEANYMFKLRPGQTLWPWLTRHSSWLTNRYRVRPDGTTAYQATYGVGYTSPIVQFAETVLAKIPESKSRRRRGRQRPRGKAESPWCKSIWVGKHDRTDEHIVLTPEGVFRCRTIRRLVGAARWDRDLLGNVTGLPDSEPIKGEDIISRLRPPVAVGTPAQEVGPEVHAGEPLDGDGTGRPQDGAGLQGEAAQAPDPQAAVPDGSILENGDRPIWGGVAITRRRPMPVGSGAPQCPWAEIRFWKKRRSAAGIESDKTS